MEAKDRTGVYERAVGGMRRLTELATDSGEGDVVRDALVCELRVVLDLESVKVASCDQSAAALAEAAGFGGGEPGAPDLAGDTRRGLVLELRSRARTQEAVILLARDPHGLGPDEVAAAAALVDVAAVVLGLLSAQHEAATDELTGCLSRRAGFARLDEEIARSHRTRSPVSCLMLDLDNLKQINDTFGHLEGDRVLREVGASLRGELRAYDVAARYGGDEFLVLLPAAEGRAALQAATRMTIAVARIRSPGDERASVPVSVTFGEATSRPRDVPDTLLERVDQALLNAKSRTHQANGPAHGFCV
jgi:diguanylate cyclase (GGDEF)-like protein